MVNGRRVVFKKPKLKKPIDLKPEKKMHSIDKPQPEILRQEAVIEIPDVPENLPKTKSRRTLIIKPDELIIEEPHRTFDEKFLEQLDIKSRITKDHVTLEKLQKRNSPQKPKPKPKKRITMLTLIIMMLFVIITIWTYKIIGDYLADTLDGSLASFMYVVAMILLTIIVFVWFIIEITLEDKN